jgi:hypothetical protein
MQLPQPRRELSDTRGGLYGDALQHIDELNVRLLDNLMSTNRSKETLTR